MAKSVLDAGWSDFKRMLSYKSIRNGGSTLEVSEYRAPRGKGKIGMAIAASRRRSDRNEDRSRPRDRRGKIGGKGKSALPHVVSDNIGQAGFEDRHFPGLQSLDFLSIAVNANDRMSEIRETRPRHEPDVARTDHCNVHLSPPTRR